MTAAAVPLPRPGPVRLRPTTRGVIMAVVVAAHVAAILLLLTGGAATIARDTQRALAVFDIAPPPPPPPDPPPPPPKDRATQIAAAPKRAPSPPPGGRAPGPVAAARAPTFARVPREITFDSTPTLAAPPILAGAAPLPGLSDGGAAGLGGTGNGTGRGRGDGGGNGGGRGPGFARASWIYEPGVDEMMRFFPAPAAKAEVSGRALLACQIPRPGKPESCRAIAEGPTDMGFGEAAVKLSALFRIRPVLREGRPMTDVPIIIPVVFQLKKKPPPPPLICPQPYCAPVPGYKASAAQ